MSVITWSSRPSAGSNASSSASDIREMKLDIATGLGQRFYWPGSGGTQGASNESSGELQAGTMRLAAVSPTGEPDGSMIIFYARPGVFHAGSSGSYYLGGRRGLTAPGPNAGNIVSHWVVDRSITTFALSATEANNSYATTSFYNTTFGAVPNVQAQIELDDGIDGSIAAFFGCSEVGTSRCSSALSILGNPAAISIATLHISSMGTVEF